MVATCFGLVLSTPIGLTLQKMIAPYALQEQREHIEATPQGRGFFWPRHATFVPLTFGLSILSTVILSGAVVVVKLLGVRDLLMAKLDEGASKDVIKSLLQDMGGALFADLGFALLWVVGLVLLLPTLTTWLLVRTQVQGIKAVQRVVEELAEGRVVSPDWVSTDEVGDMAASANRALGRLKLVPLKLKDAASRLQGAGNTLSVANQAQHESLSRQSAAIQELQVTSQEIKQTSLAAAERAQSVLQVAQRAEVLGKQGGAAVEASLAQLASMHEFVISIRDKLARLQDSANQIANITLTVKDLADQSNLLALNAAIEAVRSGEHGKGFTVVAREIRSLANQSISATTNIRNILEVVREAIGDAVQMGNQGAQSISNGAEQLKSSSESLRELSQMSQESSSSVQQIVASVTQQSTAFMQVFTAIGELSNIMNATVSRLDASQEAAEMLQKTSGEVGEVAKQFSV
jgi:methyl-accepting chemotaxis protein